MNRTILKLFIAAALCSAAVSVSAQSFGEVASATLDAVRESRDQAAAPENIRAIFAKAKSAKESGGVDFCGFYVGMEKSDATALDRYYELGSADSSFDGDPLVYSIHFSLAGVRKIMKGGNSFQELCQGVANRVGNLNYVNDLFDGEKWEYKTIDGLVVKIRELTSEHAFVMEDTTGKIKERCEAEQRALQDDTKRRAVQQFLDLPVSQEERPAMDVAMPNDISMRFRQLPNGLWFGETEVTQEQWESLMGDNPSDLKWPTRPVNNVYWGEVQNFVREFNKHVSESHSDLVFRLPEPDEWRYACRADGTGNYCRAANGKEVATETLGLIAWTKENSDEQTHPVGKKMGNAWGLYDMLGNVSEWGPKDKTKNDEEYFLYGWSFRFEAENREGFHMFDTTHAAYSTNKQRGNDIGFRLCASSKAEEDQKANELNELKNELNELKKWKDAAAIAELIADMVAIPKQDYSIGKYEVTQAQWSAIMGNNPSERKGDDLPVENITWNECHRFLKKLNARPEAKAAGLHFRIPTSEEWWNACHAGSSEKLGDISCYLEDGTIIKEKQLDRVGWMVKTGEYVGYDTPGSLDGRRILSETHPVGMKMPNAFGLYDMFGNVREMVEIKVEETKSHECLGGSWKRSPSFKPWVYSTVVYDDVGFRLCAETISENSKQTEESEVPEGEHSENDEDASANTFSEAFRLNLEDVRAIDALPRILDFDVFLELDDKEALSRKLAGDSAFALSFFRTMRTLGLDINQRMEIKLTYGNGMQRQTITVSSDEDVITGINEFLESLPDSVHRRKVLKTFRSLVNKSH